MPAHVIDKGIPTAGLLAQVMIAKYADHQPLYRQAQIFARAGVEIPRSTLAEWIGICGVRLQPLIDALRDTCSPNRYCTPMKRRCPCWPLHALCRVEGGDLRLRAWPRRPACPGLPR